ncbi:ciliary microtubule-associated protein 2-like [Amphiura filiformis]|uniref:ciliary microtubule-associated protein 2-like n=1 Tax=Amphiura filiformis TaxID=82378 RepID=UPI003B21A052
MAAAVASVKPKTFQGAPFGTQKSRFDVSGVHPQSKMPGTFTQVWYCNKSMHQLRRKMGPGTYSSDEFNPVGNFSKREVERKSSGPGWARAYQVSRMASLPHLLHKEQWEKKRMIEKNLGPGSYQIKDFLNHLSDQPRSTRGICATKEKRFRGTATSSVPGPGTYGEGGIPHSAIEKKAQQSTSTVGILDAGSSTPRNLPSVGCPLGPGTYEHKSFTEGITNKVTSVRGPYDLFTGERNAPVKAGHFAKPGRHALGPGQYELNSFTDKWQDEHHVFKGKLGKINQYPDRPAERMHCSTLSQWPRPASEPGPGHYKAKTPSTKESQAKNSPAFISSAERFDKRARKFFTGQTNPVGAGRYDVQRWEEAQHKDGHSSVFNSKVFRKPTSRDGMMQERMRAVNLRPEDKTSLTQPQSGDDYIRARKVIYAQQSI